MTYKNIHPSHKCPPLNLKSINNADFDLHRQVPENFTALFFYRGLHCPICKNQLQELEKNISHAESIKQWEEQVHKLYAEGGSSKDIATQVGPLP